MAHDISKIEFDEWREWIKRQRSKLKKDWDFIKYGGASDEEGLKLFLQSHIEVEGFTPADITLEDWFAIVASQKAAEEEQMEIIANTKRSMLVSSDLENDTLISTNPGSAWQQYRKHLKVDSGFSDYSLDVLECECYQIMKKLNGDTRETTPVKGLVIGNVQSGKTASMAGLMAMAADNGWNMFIILSGTIENLRVQTESRLYNDLSSPDGNLIWQALEKGLSKKPKATHGQTKHLLWKSRMRYFTVCLKNKSRLSNLIKWLQADPTIQEQLKILVIDDEADQAGINTGDVKQEDADRKAINRLIVNLVNGKTEKNKDAEGRYLAMNYICYTATPYANFLNENYAQSLYPSNFLISLHASKQYIGPSQIFGEDDENGYDGMNIIREIVELPAVAKTSTTVDEMDLISNIHKDGSLEYPQSFYNSVCWFLCAVAAMRYNNYKKPITMLVHTSIKQDHHANFANVVNHIINHMDPDTVLANCKTVYEQEVGSFTKADFEKAYPEYERPISEIPDYPDFEAIVPEIKRILSITATAIQLDEENDFTYHAGIHLCVDNCANNGINDENMHVRLMYPSDDAMPTPAPAFIVVGGSTLSRGLTLQGLVCTYFARKVNQADSLMQMGRWFGYRKNYELYQRIWMTEDTLDKFIFLTQLDVELRKEIATYQALGKTPADYGPRIKNSPKASFLQITAKKKMQMAVETGFDFTGVITETITFPDKKSLLDHNLSATKAFLEMLHKPEIARWNSGYIWRNIPFSTLSGELLKECKYASQGKVFNQLSVFMDWIVQVTTDGLLDQWNVALAGGISDEADPKSWCAIPGCSVNKIVRNAKVKAQQDGLLTVGVVRNVRDLIIDVQDDNLSEVTKNNLAQQKNYISNNHFRIRQEAGLGKNPLLIIYIIDKDSKPKDENSRTRTALNAPADVVSFSIVIPGSATGNNTARQLQIKARPMNGDIDDETDN